jgi:hypothetical protein
MLVLSVPSPLQLSTPRRGPKPSLSPSLTQDLEGNARRNLGRTVCTRYQSRKEMEQVYCVEICKMASINLGDSVFALPSTGRKGERATSLPTACELSGLIWNFCVQQTEARWSCRGLGSRAAVAELGGISWLHL